MESLVFQETGEALTVNLEIASLEKKVVVQNQMPVVLQSLQAIKQKRPHNKKIGSKPKTSWKKN